MKKRAVIFSLILSLVTSFSYAGCRATNIVIVNDTPELCTLVIGNLRHGYFDLVSGAPVYLPSKTVSIPIILSVGIHGSDLVLSYHCGDNRFVTFETKHAFHLFSSGKIYGHLISKQNMMAEYQAKQGSCLWGEHASIQWLLK